MLPAEALYVSWNPDNAGIMERVMQEQYEKARVSVGWRKAGAEELGMTRFTRTSSSYQPTYI
jgi:hypothetical protein